MAVTSINIDPKLLAKLKKLARERVRSVSFLVSEAIKQFLESQPKGAS
jgi:predicted transcriptional regulator